MKWLDLVACSRRMRHKIRGTARFARSSAARDEKARLGHPQHLIPVPEATREHRMPTQVTLPQYDLPDEAAERRQQLTSYLDACAKLLTALAEPPQEKPPTKPAKEEAKEEGVVLSEEKLLRDDDGVVEEEDEAARQRWWQRVTPLQRLPHLYQRWMRAKASPRIARRLACRLWRRY